MKILVTGRAGQLVSSLAERAQHDPDISLVALGRPELDLERPGAVGGSFADARRDLVI